ncbi:MAG: hypothetical protein ABIJ61_01335, partial [bacterium]
MLVAILPGRVAADPLEQRQQFPRLMALDDTHLDRKETTITQLRSSSPFILRQLMDDMTYLAGQPDFYAVVGGVGIIPTLFGSAFKRESPEFTEMWGASVFADGFFEAGEGLGEALYPVTASTALWAVGRLSHSNSLGDLGSDLLRAQAINGIVTLSLKVAINRRRPNGGPYSYPSGHTTSAFAIAAVIYRDCGRTWGIPAFVLASYGGLSR